MAGQTVKIYSKQDFSEITKGMKIANCMENKISDIKPENLLESIEQLIVSDSLICSYCNTEFVDKVQQRLHYKLDWHRFNLKQHLHGLQSISESDFNLRIINSIPEELTDLNELDFQYLSGLSDDSDDNEDDYFDTLFVNDTREMKESNNKKETSKSPCNVVKSPSKNCKKSASEDVLSHTKIFFENDNGVIFSIYRCLLCGKKDDLEMDSNVISKALEIGKKSTWTIVMVGGGHFAAAVFSDGKTLVHKTFHGYTIRAKQGSSQNVQDNRAANRMRSAGSNLRRHNEAHLIQRVQSILKSWSPYIENSFLVFYRAVGTYNHSVLFNGENAPFDKKDPRLRSLPFPTRKPTFNEVKRVYNLLSSVEIHGSTTPADLQPTPACCSNEKTLKTSDVDCKQENSNKCEKQSENLNVNSNRTKTKSKKGKQTKKNSKTCQMFPDSESEIENCISLIEDQDIYDICEEDTEISFKDNLLEYEDTVPKHVKKNLLKKTKKKKV